MNTRKVILLVEDSPDDVALTLRAFNKSHIADEVVVAKDGPEPLDYLFGPGPKGGRGSELSPQLILLDLKLPKLEGLDVLKLIRSDERTRRIPIVILTSSGEEQDIINSYELGVNSYIRKPVNFDQFVEAVRQLGSYWLILNEPAPQNAG